MHALRRLGVLVLLLSMTAAASAVEIYRAGDMDPQPSVVLLNTPVRHLVGYGTSEQAANIGVRSR